MGKHYPMKTQPMSNEQITELLLDALGDVLERLEKILEKMEKSK